MALGFLSCGELHKEYLHPHRYIRVFPRADKRHYLNVSFVIILRLSCVSNRSILCFLVFVRNFPPFTCHVRKRYAGVRNWICNLERTPLGQLPPDEWSLSYWLTTTNDGLCFHQGRNLSVAKILKRFAFFAATSGIQIVLWKSFSACSFIFVFNTKHLRVFRYEVFAQMSIIVTRSILWRSSGDSVDDLQSYPLNLFSSYWWRHYRCYTFQWLRERNTDLTFYEAE